MARAKTKPITVAPIFAAIEAHRVAYAAMDRAIGVRNGNVVRRMVGDRPSSAGVLKGIRSHCG